MDIEVDSTIYKRQLLLEETEALLDHETFHAIGSFESNVYVGTSLGQLLHYHRFEDSPGFILISQQNIKNSPVTKIIILPSIGRAAILCGGTISIFSLPELSPLQAGKLKEVEDILLLKQTELLVLTKNKLRIIRLNQTDIKLVKDINDISPIQAVGHLSNNLVTIANESEYEIVDLENIRKVPLFQYTDDQSVSPNIVSYQAGDTQKEELLLTIKSDANTSIGMFINAEGDPCRGTISWVEMGYPTGGVIVNWPHVFGVFNNTLVVSSLTELSIKYTEDCKGRLVYLPIPTSIQDDNYLLNGIWKNSIPCNIVLLESNTIHSIYPETQINLFQQQLLKLISADISDIQFPESGSIDPEDVVYKQLVFLYYLFRKDYTKLSEIMDDNCQELLLYLYHTDSDNELKSTLYLGIKKVADMLKRKLDDDWKRFAVKQIRETYLNSHKLALQSLAYSNFSSSQEFIDFAKKDKECWKVETPNLTKIVTNLESNNLYLAALHLYILLKNDEKICSLSAKFLTGEYKNDITFDFVQLILNSLDKVKDAKTYRDILLEVLRAAPDKGIDYMKKNINGRYKNTHNDILKQVYDVVDNEDFSHLKLEVLENGLKSNDGNTSLDELLEHLLDMLRNPGESVVNNITILYQTYLIGNSYDSHKNIISWPNFLQTNMAATECKDFLEIYLKTFELLNYKKPSIEALGSLAENPIYEFFRICCCGSTTDTVISLINYKDYFSAEFTAIYGKMPYTRTKYFVHEDLKAVDDIKSNLTIIFNHYKEHNILPAIRHFVNSYGTVFLPEEIIDMLPQDIPLSYIQQYFLNLFIDLETTQRKLIIKKLFNRQDAKFTNELYTDLT